MAIARRAAGGTAGNASGGNLSATVTSTLANSIMVAALYREAGAWTLPSGWAQWGSDQQDYNTNFYLTLAWKRTSGSETSYTFNLSATTWRIIVIDEFTGAATSGDPKDVGPTSRGTNESTDGTHGAIASSITTTLANTMCIAAIGSYNGTDSTANATGYSAGNSLGGLEIWYAAQAVAGASGDKTFGSFSGSDQGLWATHHLAIKEPTAAAGSRVLRRSVWRAVRR